MKNRILNKIFIAILYAASIFLLWGGLFYATNDPQHFQSKGIIMALIGLGLFFWCILFYDKNLGQ